MRPAKYLLFVIALLLGTGLASATVINIRPTITISNGIETVAFQPFNSISLNNSQMVQFVFGNATISGVTLSNSVNSTGTVGVATITAPGAGNTLKPLNVSITLPCGGQYAAPEAYNAVINAPSCNINQNLTFRSGTSNQVYRYSHNETITILPILKQNIAITCKDNWNATYNYTNTTTNTIFTCAHSSLNLTINATPSANSTMTFEVAGKEIPFYGTSINDSQYGVRINDFYPQINKNLTVLPGFKYRNPAANLTITAPNAVAFFNLTLEAKLYNETYRPSCFDGVNENGNFVCIQQTPNSTALTSICPEQWILDKNISEGLNQCVINFHKTDVQNYTTVSNELTYQQSLTLQWQKNNNVNYSAYQLAEANRVPWNDIFGYIIVIVLIVSTAWAVGMRKSLRPK